MVINAETNVVVYQGRQLAGMDDPSFLPSQDLSNTGPRQTAEKTHSVFPVNVREQLVLENRSIGPTVAVKVEET